MVKNAGMGAWKQANDSKSRAAVFKNGARLFLCRRQFRQRQAANAAAADLLGKA